MRIAALTASLAAALVLAACNEPDDRPYLSFAGGGFVFNYRIGQAFYGFVAQPKKPMPEGAMIEARFEIPGSEAPFVERRPTTAGMLRYTFRTPPLKGIVKDHKYRVELRVIASGSDEVLASYVNSYHTDVNQASLPDKPLVLGPGYTPNPEVDISKLPSDKSLE
jgi:hypothetical protein